MVKRATKACILMIVMFISSACFTTVQPPVRARGIPVVDGERQAMLQKIEERKSEVKSVRSLLRAFIKQEDERYRYRYALAFSGPDKLRLDVLPLNNAFPLGVFAATSERQVLLQVPEKKAVVSNSYTNLLERVTGLPLPERDFPWLILGILPIDKGVEISREGEDGTLVFLSKNKRYRAIMAEEPFRLKSLEIRDTFQQQLHARIQYEYANETELTPKKLLLSFPRYNAEGSIRITSLALNPDLKESVFELVIPEEFSVTMK